MNETLIRTAATLPDRDLYSLIEWAATEAASAHTVDYGRAMRRLVRHLSFERTERRLAFSDAVQSTIDAL